MHPAGPASQSLEAVLHAQLAPVFLIPPHAGSSIHLPRAGTAPKPRPCVSSSDAPAPGSGSTGSAHHRSGLAGGPSQPPALRCTVCVCSRPAGESAALAVHLFDMLALVPALLIGSGQCLHTFTVRHGQRNVCTISQMHSVSGHICMSQTCLSCHRRAEQHFPAHALPLQAAISQILPSPFMSYAQRTRICSSPAA